MAAGIRLLLPDADVRHWAFMTGRCGPPEPIFEELAGSDLVISQVIGARAEAFEESRLRKVAGQVVLMPPMIFAGFHPDTITCKMAGEDRGIEGPAGGLHSAVVLAAYQLGLPAERVPALDGQ